MIVLRNTKYVLASNTPSTTNTHTSPNALPTTCNGLSAGDTLPGYEPFTSPPPLATHA